MTYFFSDSIISMTELDNIFDIASQQLPAKGIDCLLIGGFAVNHYGYTRNTLDVDFMIVGSCVNDVRNIMTEAGYTNVDIRDNVAFFSREDEGKSMRVDFLRVDESTLKHLLDGSVMTKIRNRELRVPDLKHLLAMKVHALAQDTARRMGKDLPDIAYLSVINGLDCEEDIKPLCEQFGTPDVYKLIHDQIRGIQE